MKIIGFIICFFLLVGCSSREPLVEEMTLKHGIYFHKDSNTPYTGKAISRFESGKVSYIMSFKDGIPQGDFATFGYQRDTIQYGKYYTLPIDTLKTDAKILRVNLCTTHEGSHQVADFLVILDEKVEIDSTRNSDFTGLLQPLQSLIKADSSARITIMHGELETKQVVTIKNSL